MFTVGNANGLMASSATHRGPQTTRPFYLVDEGNGNAMVNGDLTVEGNIYASTIISTPEVSGNPFYIKNDNNLGSTPFEDCALIVEAGANRSDVSGDSVTIATYKPISQKVISYSNAEDIGTFTSFGLDLSDNKIRYASMRISCTNPTTNNTLGRIDFSVQRNNIHEACMQIDASGLAITTQSNYRFKDRGYNIYPGGVKITTAGAITKETSATLVPESAFTVPAGLDGYYSFTAQISLGTVGTVADGDNIAIYLDVSGGSLTPVNGTINILDMTENSANAFNATPGGIIMQRLTAGQVIQLYHLETGSYLFSTGSIQVAYTYLGDTLLA